MIRRLLLLLSCAFVVALLWWVHYHFLSPERAFEDFVRGEGRSESYLKDPLILAGRGVAPLVLDAISDRNFLRRRYGIAFLGCMGYRPAEGALFVILEDEAEEDYFRADALQALWRLRPQERTTLPLKYRDGPGHLGETAKQLLAEGPWTECKTRWEVLFGEDE
jgi:hypothetical protein